MFSPILSLLALGATLTLTAASPLAARAGKVEFSTAPPAEIKGGEEFEIAWRGGSDSYTLEYIEEYDNGDHVLLHTVLKDSAATTHKAYFGPPKCFQESTTIRFIVYDSEGIAQPGDRAYSNKLKIVAGDKEDTDCEAAAPPLE